MDITAQQTAAPVQNVIALQWDVVGAIWALFPLMLVFMVLGGVEKLVSQVLQPETLRAAGETAKAVAPLVGPAPAALLEG